MNKYLSFIAGVVGFAVCALAPASVTAAPMPNGLVARIHFAGGDAVAADPNYLPVRNIWSSPEAAALRNQTLDKLDRFLDVWLRQEIAPNLGNSLQVRSLLADLYPSEWQLDLYQAGGNSAEFSLAVRLDNARSSAWQGTLGPVVAAWTQSSPAHHGQLLRSGQWLFLKLGNSPVPSPAASISPLNGQWLTAEVDWTRLGTWFPGVLAWNLPETQLNLVGRNRKIDMQGNLFLTQPLPPLEKWQIPTEMHAPVISVLATRGISNWLKQNSWVNSLGLSSMPDQLFNWVMPQSPFANYASAPIADPMGALPKLAAAFDHALHDGEDAWRYRPLKITQTNDEVVLTGLPWTAPSIAAKKTPSGEYLFGSLFPVIGFPTPLPGEISTRFNDPSLVYFHWEDTAQRIKVSPQLYQLLLIITGHHQLDAASVAGIWLQHAQPALGTSVTEVTERSPTELAFSRESTSGLTAVELVAFASWLEAPNFPGCDLRLPPPRRHAPRPHPTNTPTPFILHH